METHQGTARFQLPRITSKSLRTKQVKYRYRLMGMSTLSLIASPSKAAWLAEVNFCRLDTSIKSAKAPCFLAELALRMHL